MPYDSASLARTPQPPTADLLALVAWTVATFVLALVLSRTFRLGLAAWLRILILLVFFFIGHIIQIPLSVRGLPGLPEIILSPFLVISIPAGYYNDARVGGVSYEDAQSFSFLWGGLHAALIYLYIGVNIYTFRLLRRRRPEEIAIPHAPPAVLRNTSRQDEY